MLLFCLSRYVIANRYIYIEQAYVRRVPRMPYCTACRVLSPLWL